MTVAGHWLQRLVRRDAAGRSLRAGLQVGGQRRRQQIGDCRERGSLPLAELALCVAQGAELAKAAPGSGQRHRHRSREPRLAGASPTPTAALSGYVAPYTKTRASRSEPPLSRRTSTRATSASCVIAAAAISYIEARSTATCTPIATALTARRAASSRSARSLSRRTRMASASSAATWRTRAISPRS